MKTHSAPVSHTKSHVTNIKITVRLDVHVDHSLLYPVATGLMVEMFVSLTGPV